MLESNSYRVYNGVINPNMAAYVQQNSSYGYTQNFLYESPLTLNTLANPYAFHSQKMDAIGQAYQMIHGHQPMQPQMMKTQEMDPRGQQAAAKANDYDNERMTNEQMKGVGDLVWKGLKGMSRFYAQDKVPVGGAQQSNASRFGEARGSEVSSDYQRRVSNIRSQRRSSSQSSMVGNVFYDQSRANALDLD